MYSEDGLTFHLRRLEESLLRPDIRKSELASQLLAESFIEFGSSGRQYDKAQVIASLRSESPVTITVHKFKVSSLGSNVALVTYRACLDTEPLVHTLRSSIWQPATRGKMANGFSSRHHHANSLVKTSAPNE